MAFLSHFVSGDLNACLDLLVSTQRLPEAAFFARTYLPHKTSEIVQLWKEHVGKVSEKASKSIANPEEYPNLFPGFKVKKEEEVDADDKEVGSEAP